MPIIDALVAPLKMRGKFTLQTWLNEAPHDVRTLCQAGLEHFRQQAVEPSYSVTLTGGDSYVPHNALPSPGRVYAQPRQLPRARLGSQLALECGVPPLGQQVEGSPPRSSLSTPPSRAMSSAASDTIDEMEAALLNQHPGSKRSGKIQRESTPAPVGEAGVIS